jgi:hypothetical protein
LNAYGGTHANSSPSFNSTSPNAILTDLESYYNAQHASSSDPQAAERGYATLVTQVLEDTGNGSVAVQEIADAPSGQDTAAFRAQLGLVLADDGSAEIQRLGNEVPTLAEDADTHVLAFGQMDLPIEYWGGATFAALNRDFTLGAATAAERASLSDSGFPALSELQTQQSIDNLFVAGLQNIFDNSPGNTISATGYHWAQTATSESYQELATLSPPTAQ